MMSPHDSREEKETVLDFGNHMLGDDYEQRMREALEQSRDDYSQGRFYDSRAAMMEAVAKKRAGR